VGGRLRTSPPGEPSPVLVRIKESSPVKKLALLAIAAVALVLSACVPMFAEGSEVTATDSELGTTLEWSWADPPSEDVYVAEYRIDVDGVEVARVPGYLNSCRLQGIDPSTHYVITVTAYDTNGGWSGNFSGEVAHLGTLTADHTTSAYVPGGETRWCEYDAGG